MLPNTSVNSIGPISRYFVGALLFSFACKYNLRQTGSCFGNFSIAPFILSSSSHAHAYSQSGTRAVRHKTSVSTHHPPYRYSNEYRKMSEKPAILSYFADISALHITAFASSTMT